METAIAEAMRLTISPATPAPKIRKINPNGIKHAGAVWAVGPVGRM